MSLYLGIATVATRLAAVLQPIQAEEMGRLNVFGRLGAYTVRLSRTASPLLLPLSVEEHDDAYLTSVRRQAPELLPRSGTTSAGRTTRDLMPAVNATNWPNAFSAGRAARETTPASGSPTKTANGSCGDEQEGRPATSGISTSPPDRTTGQQVVLARGGDCLPPTFTTSRIHTSRGQRSWSTLRRSATCQKICRQYYSGPSWPMAKNYYNGGGGIMTVPLADATAAPTHKHTHTH